MGNRDPTQWFKYKMPPTGSCASTSYSWQIELFLEVVVSGHEVLLADTVCSSEACGLFLSPAPRMSSLLPDVCDRA